MLRLHIMSFLLNPTTEPKDQFAEIFLLWSEHLKCAVVVLVLTKERAERRFVCGSCWYWVEVPDYTLTFWNRINSTNKQGKQSIFLMIFNLSVKLLVKQVLVQVTLILVHVYHSHSTYFQPFLRYTVGEEKLERVLIGCLLSKVLIILDQTILDLLKDHTDVFILKLVKAILYFISIVNLCVSFRIRVISIEGRISSDKVPGFFCAHWSYIILNWVFHKERYSVQCFFGEFCVIEF